MSKNKVPTIDPIAAFNELQELKESLKQNDFEALQDLKKSLEQNDNIETLAKNLITCATCQLDNPEKDGLSMYIDHTLTEIMRSRNRVGKGVGEGVIEYLTNEVRIVYNELIKTLEEARAGASVMDNIGKCLSDCIKTLYACVLIVTGYAVKGIGLTAQALSFNSLNHFEFSSVENKGNVMERSNFIQAGGNKLRDEGLEIFTEMHNTSTEELTSKKNITPQAQKTISTLIDKVKFISTLNPNLPKQ